MENGALTPKKQRPHGNIFYQKRKKLGEAKSKESKIQHVRPLINNTVLLYYLLCYLPVII